MRNTFPTDSEILAGLCAARNLELFRTLESKDFDFTPERGLAESYRDFDNHVVALAMKKLVIRNVYENVQISWRRSGITRFAFTLKPEAGTGLHSGRYSQAEFLSHDNPPSACTFFTRVGYDSPAALT
jgi:hypothetical protein